MCIRDRSRRTKKGGIFFFLLLPAGLTVYFISIYVGAAMGAEWALNNPTYVHMNSWFHYAKLYAATAGCIGFMMLKYKWGIAKNDWFKAVSYTHLDVYKRQALRDPELLTRCARAFGRQCVVLSLSLIHILLSSAYWQV